MASQEDGRLATPLTYIHYSTNNMPLASATFYVKGSINNKQTEFLLDSGAAISVIHQRMLPTDMEIRSAATTAVGATGTPLVIKGHVMLSVLLGQLTVMHKFTVVQDLTVSCLLGADFLRRYNAIVDCGNCLLHLSYRQQQHTIPISQETNSVQQLTPVSPRVDDDMTVIAPVNIIVPGRTVQLILGQINPSDYIDSSVLVEPSSKLPSHLCLARSLSPLLNHTEVILQVMNTSPTPLTIYKGMKLATATLRHNILSISEMGPHVCENSMNSTVLPDGIDLSHLSPSEQTELTELLVNYSHVFSQGRIPTGHTSVVKHSIPTSGAPIRQPLRRLPQALKSTVSDETHYMLDNKIIRPSSSPWCSPVVMVRKKDGSWRFCIDYRKLNAVTCRDAYPLPRIDSTLDSLSGATYFTTLDLASGYWQVEVEEADKEKTAFSTLEGHFEFNVMPFGLTNAPATFQRLMECVLAGLVGEECLIYLDDIIVFSSTFKEHLLRLSRVFQALCDAGLQLKPSKCHLALKQVRYLGHIVSKDGITPDNDKISAVIGYPVPSNAKQLKQFLGLSNYYRRFIRNYALIAEPLHKILRKSKQPFQWNEACQHAFETLKQKLTTPPILTYPNFKEPFLVYTDASEVAVGGVLGQIQDGKEVVISYWSRQLTKAEKNYSTIEREALAAVCTIKEFYAYLYGFSFKLITDHNPLTSLQALKDVGGRLSRWLMYLQQFQFTVEYRMGKQHANADAMSRVPASTAVMPVISHQLSTSVDIIAAQQADDQLSTVMKALTTKSPLPSTTPPGLKHCFLENGLLCRTFQGPTNNTHTQLVLPSKLRHTALQQLHNELGHLGYHKTMERVKQRYYWPGYERDVQAWISECSQCQQRKAPNPAAQAPLGTVVAKHPFDILSWDILGPLPLTNQGNKYILVVTDLFSKWTEAFALKTTDSETLARVLVDEVICRYGMPSTLHSDQGANLTSNLIASLCKMLGIRQTRTSAYHPQGNAQVERFNRTLEAMLAKTVKDNQQDWDRHIPKLLLAYRTAIHETTGYTPFHVMFGRSPVLPVEIMIGVTSTQKESTVPDFVRSLNRSLKTVCSQVRESIRIAHQRNKARYDQHTTATSFSIGDQVWLFVPAVKTGRTKKLASLWRGPYTVTDKLSPVNYRIQLLGVPNKTLVVHHNRLKHCFGTPTPPPATDTPTTDGTLYSEVLRGQVSQVAGYTTSSPETSTGAIRCSAASSTPATADARPSSGTVDLSSTASTSTRPQRSHRPPSRYTDFIAP